MGILISFNRLKKYKYFLILANSKKYFYKKNSHLDRNYCPNEFVLHRIHILAMNYNENNPRYFKNQTDSIKNRNPRGGSQKSIRPWILAAWLLGISFVGEPLRAEPETLQKISLEQGSDSLKDFSADFQFKAGTICQGGTCGIRTDTGQYHRDETCPFCNSHLAKQGEDKSLKAGFLPLPL